ncbi:hypothetical protein Tco_1135959 [Tanacetum coccineum]
MKLFQAYRLLLFLYVIATSNAIPNCAKPRCIDTWGKWELHTLLESEQSVLPKNGMLLIATTQRHIYLQSTTSNAGVNLDDQTVIVKTEFKIAVKPRALILRGSVLTGCSTACINETVGDKKNFLGFRCCKTQIPHYLKSYSVNLRVLERHGGDGGCGSAFLVDHVSYIQGSKSFPNLRYVIENDFAVNMEGTDLVLLIERKCQIFRGEVMRYWVQSIAERINEGEIVAEVAKVLVEAFAEMIFVHGFLHGDPNPDNILVSLDEKHGFCLGHHTWCGDWIINSNIDVCGNPFDPYLIICFPFVMGFWVTPKSLNLGKDPLLCGCGLDHGEPMDLNFQLFETATLFITVLVVAFMLQLLPVSLYTLTINLVPSNDVLPMLIRSGGLWPI